MGSEARSTPGVSAPPGSGLIRQKCLEVEMKSKSVYNGKA
jgi:hypothetical protein